MPLLFVIGTLGAIACIWLSRRKNNNPRVLVRTEEGFLEEGEAAAKILQKHLNEKEAWLVEHTDSFFRKPIGEGYNAPFPHKKDGYVLVEIEEE